MVHTPEHLKESPIRVEGKEILSKIKKWNTEGKHVLFAPNHLKPQGKLAGLRAQSALADDYPQLKKVLREHGIDSVPIMRGDTNMKLGSTIAKKAYNVHRKLFSLFGKAVTGGIPVAINSDDPVHSVSINVGAAKEIVRTLKEQNNIVLYPHGNWYDSGTQNFKEEEDLHDGEFIPMKDFEAWRTGIKKGFASAARQSNAPIVPVYIEHDGDNWTFKFGEPIEPVEAESKRQGDTETAKAYLKSMRELKAGEKVDPQI